MRKVLCEQMTLTQLVETYKGEQLWLKLREYGFISADEYLNHVDDNLNKAGAKLEKVLANK